MAQQEARTLDHNASTVWLDIALVLCSITFDTPLIGSVEEKTGKNGNAWKQNNSGSLEVEINTEQKKDKKQKNSEKTQV